MKLRNLAFATVAAASSLVSFVPAQTQPKTPPPRRVEFAPGSTTVTVDGGTGGEKTPYETYRLMAEPGQPVHIKVVRVSGRGDLKVAIGTVESATPDTEVWNEYKPVYKDRNISSYTHGIEPGEDLLMEVSSESRISYKLSFSIPAKKRSQVVTKTPVSPGVASCSPRKDRTQSDGSVIKYICLNPKTKTAVVSGRAIGLDSEPTTYFDVPLLDGQRLLITADSQDLAVETYTNFHPLDGGRGCYQIVAAGAGGYQVVTRSRTPNMKYTLMLKLLSDNDPPDPCTDRLGMKSRRGD